jgi:glycosyltransferase involved in cell wall biosynthesis
MKIAIISTLFGSDHGGSEALWVPLALKARQKGHEVLAYVYEKKTIHPALQSVIDSGVKVMYQKHQAVPSSITGKIAFVFKRKILGYNPYTVLDSFSPDIIYVNQAGSIDAATDQNLREYLHASKTPYFINPHQVSEINRVVQASVVPHVQQVFNEAKGLVFVSKRNKEILYSSYGISNPNVYYSVYPVVLSSMDNVPYPPLNGTVSFATVAALNCEQKGQDILMEVLSTDKWKSRKWIWNLYGKGPDEDKLRTMAKEKGLEDRVCFQGFTSDVREVWKQNHLHVFPTLSEGMPLAITESLVCGRPVAATDIGGISEWVKDGETGFIAEKPEVKFVDEALERAWIRKDEWEAMSIKARQRFMQQYNFNFAEDLLNYITR